MFFQIIHKTTTTSIMKKIINKMRNARKSFFSSSQSTGKECDCFCCSKSVDVTFECLTSSCRICSLSKYSWEGNSTKYIKHNFVIRALVLFLVFTIMMKKLLVSFIAVDYSLIYNLLLYTIWIKLTFDLSIVHLLWNTQMLFRVILDLTKLNFLIFN